MAITSLMLGFGLASQLSVSPSPRMMFIPFENQLKDQTQSISLAPLDTIQSHLLQTSAALQLIDHRQTQAVLEQLKGEPDALKDPQVVQHIGKVLNARYVLTGTVRSGKIHTSATTTRQRTAYSWATIEVSAQLIDSQTGALHFSSTATGQSERYPNWQGSTYTSLIVEAVHRASEQLAQKLAAQTIHAGGTP